MTTIDYISTRGHPDVLNAAQAIACGLAPDGGLYVPREFPRLTASDFADALTDSPSSLATTAATLIAPFVKGSVLANDIETICQEAFSFEIPCQQLPTGEDRALHVLEVFHGPTAAFKDVGARFLAACMERIERDSSQRLRILVATSGDTGGAVAAAFHGRKSVDVDVFYPAGQVSPRQEQQLTCWGGNIRAFKVNGVFDDCQSLVKAVFQDQKLSSSHRFSSANSINLGRLLPQMVYYAHTALRFWREQGKAPSFIIPTGNLGNALACVWARRAGLPIGDIVLATNANKSIPSFLSTGEWNPSASVSTLASAMDVGNPSNMERLRNLYGALDDIRGQVVAFSVSDENIAGQIKRDYKRYEQVWCPHTATAFHVYDHMTEEQQKGASWIGVGTAHPAKFEDIVEPLIERTVEVPPALASLLELPTHAIEISAQLAELSTYY